MIITVEGRLKQMEQLPATEQQQILLKDLNIELTFIKEKAKQVIKVTGE